MKTGGFVSKISTYLLTPWTRVLLEKLTGSALVKKFPAFLEPEGSSPYSQVPATCPYLPPINVWVSPMASFPQVSPPEPCAHPSKNQYTLQELLAVAKCLHTYL